MPTSLEISGSRISFVVLNEGDAKPQKSIVGDMTIKFRGALWELDFVSSESYPGWNKTVYEYNKKEN